MRKFLFTVAVSAAMVSSLLSGPALAARTAHDTAKPRGPVVQLRVEPGPERLRLERGLASRRNAGPVHMACENGCARPTYTRE